MPTLRELGEVEVIRRLAAARGSHGLRDDVRVDAGDDAAIVRVRAGRDLVVTTDAFVEGRHYQPEWASPARVGSRLALANVSDRCRHGRGAWATVSMGVRAEHDVESLEALQSALGATLAREGGARGRQSPLVEGAGVRPHADG
jgi:thiamine-monophosphate kinase